MIHTVVRENAYHDSVTLMLATEEIKTIEGVEEALVGMGTETNKGFLRDLGMLTPESESATPNDLLVVVKGEEGVLDKVLAKLDEFLKQKVEASAEERFAQSLDGALEMMPDANMVLISVAGEYAGREAMKALKRGLNVMLFSDNVPLEEEIRLKKYASEKGLLVMGPDCGTAIINGVPLAFANVVSRGNIGMVAAAGTGAQEVSSIISNLGGGVSQVIGTGGRDVKEAVGGITFLEGIRRLIEDDETHVIVLVSKPPHESVIEKAVQLLKSTDKKHVVHFINGTVDDPDILTAETLEDAAVKAVLLSRGEPIEKDVYTVYDFIEGPDFKTLAKEEAQKISKGEYIRGLYSGGTLTSEAMVMITKEIGPVWSPSPLDPAYRLENIHESKEHTIVDMGEDEFTQGRPHPMIDFTMRKERLVKEYLDPDTAIILLDVVLGYGSNMDPASEIAEAVKEVRSKTSDYVTVIAALCGTHGDPQNYNEQKKTLEEAGVHVFASNASAVRFAIDVWKELKA